METFIKKCHAIRKVFPGSKISIFISNSALLSSGTPDERIISYLSSDKIIAKKEEISLNVIKSAFADHYIEVGGGARSNGERKVEGLLLSF